MTQHRTTAAVRWGTTLTALLALALASALLTVRPASAQGPLSLEVQNLDYQGPGTLREAITAANADTSGNPVTITFAAGLNGYIALDASTDMVADNYGLAGSFMQGGAAYLIRAGAPVTIDFDSRVGIANINDGSTSAFLIDSPDVTIRNFDAPAFETSTNAAYAGDRTIRGIVSSETAFVLTANAANTTLQDGFCVELRSNWLERCVAMDRLSGDSPTAQPDGTIAADVTIQGVHMDDPWNAGIVTASPGTVDGLTIADSSFVQTTQSYTPISIQNNDVVNMTVSGSTFGSLAEPWLSGRIIYLYNSSIEDSSFTGNTFQNMPNGIRYVFQHGNAAHVRNVEYSGNTFTDWSPDRNWDFTDAFILDDVRILDNDLADSTPLNVVDARNVRTSITDFVFSGNEFSDYQTRGGWKVLDFRGADNVDGLTVDSNEFTNAEITGGVLDLASVDGFHRNVAVTNNTWTDSWTAASTPWLYVDTISGATEDAGDLNVMSGNTFTNADPAEVTGHAFDFLPTGHPVTTDTGWRVYDNHFAAAHDGIRAPFSVGSGYLPVERNTIAFPARGTTQAEDDAQESETGAAFFVRNVNANANGKLRTWQLASSQVFVDDGTQRARITVQEPVDTSSNPATPAPAGPVDVDVYYSLPTTPAGGTSPADDQRHAEQYLGRIIEAVDGGTYELNCPGCTDAGFLRIQTIAQDGATTQLSGSLVAVDATIPAAALTLDLADNDSLIVGDTITGSGVAGSSVTVHEDGNPANVICGPVVVPASGLWSCEIPTSATPGTYDLVATDDAGPTTTPVVSDVVIDPIPLTLDLTAAEQVVPGEDIEGTATPGATVTVADDSDNVICTAVADANGDWACPLPFDTPQGNLTVDATDGTTTTPAVTVEVLPIPVTMVLETDQEVPGGSSISGTGAPGDTVTVVNEADGDAVVCGPVTVDVDGTWTCEVPIDVEPFDDAALTAQQTGDNPDTDGPYTVDLLATPVMFDDSVGGDVVAGVEPISGTGAPGSTVTVTDGTDVVCGPVTVDAAGDWSCDLPADATTGAVNLVAEQRDETDALTSTDEASTTIVSATPTADLAQGDTLRAGIDEISGTGVPGAEVVVTDADDTVVCGPVTVEPDGSWSCIVASTAPGGPATLTVTQDIDGTAVSADPVDVTIIPPGIPAGPATPAPVELDATDGDEVTAGSPITGTGEPATTVQVVDGDDALVCGPVTVAGDGTWSCTLPEDLTPGATTLIALVIDEDGDVIDESDPVDVVVVEADGPVDPVGDPDTIRLGGLTRIETANTISQDTFDDGTASIVVLARSDNFADALAGTPLAVSGNGPVLLTPPDQLLPEVAAEIERVLVEDGRIFLLGGPVALNEDVETASAALGEVIRLQGASRVETAIDIARELGDPELLLVTTGGTFPDALSAATAAAANDGAILLTTGESSHPSTDAYLAEREVAPELYAVGGPAAAQYTDATPIVGASRTETAVRVAEAFFDGPTAVGLARQDEFADALTGGAHIARQGGPVLLTASEDLPAVVVDYVCGLALDQVFVYGGTAAIGEVVFDAVEAILDGGSCPTG